jgi:hypothetical protein
MAQRNYRPYTIEDLRQAITSVKTKEHLPHEAAVEWNIPCSSFYKHLARFKKHNAELNAKLEGDDTVALDVAVARFEFVRLGGPVINARKILDDNDMATIQGWIDISASGGFGLNKVSLKASIQKLLRARGTVDSLTGKHYTLSDHYMDNLMKVSCDVAVA